MPNTAEDVLYVHTDHLGAPQKMTDNTGAVVWDAAYMPFGSEAAISGAAVNNQRFPGQYYDAETGLHQNWLRDYDPTLGRYIQSDPIGLAGGLNTYAYVGGNPLTRIDPTGENPLLWGAVWGGADLAWQLWRNGGRLECVNYWEVLFSGALGAIPAKYYGALFGPIGRGLKAAGGRVGRFLPGAAGLGRMLGRAGARMGDVAGRGFAAAMGAAALAKGALKGVPVLGKALSNGGGGALVPKAAHTLGQWGETMLGRVLGGAGYKPTKPFATSLGYRYLDRIVGTTAHEVKAGVNVGLNSTIRNQVLKDAELLRRDPRLDEYYWHFFQGAKPELVDFLKQNGLKPILH